MGWNLPPGCTDADIDRAMGGHDPSPASQLIESILDEAGFSRKFIESILRQIDDEEEEMREDRYDWDHDR